MTRELFQKLLDSGEGYTIEYKKNEMKLSSDVYETVSSFSNRYGGHILLGVVETEKDGHKVGLVKGVDKNCIYEMKRNFINDLNNPNKFRPTLYLELEEFEYDGKTVLWTYVPPTSSLCYCDNRIYDRVGDADQNITEKTARIAETVSRKSMDYREQQILPYANESHLKMELMDRVRKLVKGRDKDHPWKDMDDMEIFRSAGLYVENVATGEKGFNLAAILLFGKPEVIKSCVPGYKTDAIYRVDNLDRYDDRDIIEDNLIEAYDKLMAFCLKHMDNRFVLEGDISVDARELIAREVVGNILIHRDYTNAFPAKLIIEREKLRTENWSKSRFNGRLSLDAFSPYPKNPLLASFFVNIGRADTLGSGMRNLYKYTKLYSNAEPILSEGDIFEICIPLKKSVVNSEKSVVDSEKSVVDSEKSVVQTRKITLDHLLLECEKHSYNATVVNNMQKIYERIDTGVTFGVSDIERIVGCARSTAIALMKRLKDMDLVVPVKGKGKGKYRLKYETEIEA